MGRQEHLLLRFTDLFIESDFGDRSIYTTYLNFLTCRKQSQQVRKRLGKLGNGNLLENLRLFHVTIQLNQSPKRHWKFSTSTKFYL